VDDHVLGDAASYTADEHRRGAALRAWEAPVTSRLGFYYALWNRLRCVAEAERRAALEALARWADRAPAVRASHRPLTRDEVRALGRDGLVELGAHAVSHPFLSTLSAEAQRDEIGRSKSDLEDLACRPVTSFAYPHGDYSAATRQLVHEAGFS
jgi:peptidoglycan/xylan/chitin deacetylase (PgdA/CDA1 family)